jgi:hypothetical protein
LGSVTKFICKIFFGKEFTNMDKQTEQARELLARHRQDEDLRQDALRSRSASELHRSESSGIESEARQSMAKERAKADEAQDKMLERSEEELHG